MKPSARTTASVLAISAMLMFAVAFAEAMQRPAANLLLSPLFEE